MTFSDRATTVASLLEASATLPGDDRQRFLQRACGNNPALLAQIESLLNAAGADLASVPASTLQSGVTARESIPATALRVPELMAGRYRIRGQLGAGGMAVVYLAEDETLHRSVALKVQRPDIIRRAGRERFEDEIRLTANLRHPNIVPLFDCGEADGFSYFVMPHVTGDTLRDRLATTGALALTEAVRISSDVLAALQHAHDAGIVHRDVKPSNIMLESSRTMLADFGIAYTSDAAQEASAQPNSAGGTPAYMSPEQATRAVRVGAASDIYSTGATLYEMLTGNRPTRASSRLQLASAGYDSWAREREAMRAVSSDVRDVIERAVALDPDDRYASAAVFARALNEAAATPAAQPSVAVAAPAVGRTGVARAWWRPVLAASVLVGAIALATRAAPSVAPRSPEMTPPTARALLDTTRVLVLPYEYAATMSSRLTGPDRFPDAVARWRGITSVSLPAGATADTGSLRSAGQLAALARSLNAGRSIRRMVEKQGDQFVIRAALLDGPGSSELASQTVMVPDSTPPADSVLQRLADELLLTHVPDSLRTAPWTGTASRPALTQFARGMDAVDSMALELADSTFRVASALDTTYARPALWLALVRTWQDAPRDEWAAYVVRAQRSAPSLSPRDARALAILAQLSAGDSARACAEWQRVAKADNADFVAWHSAARCMLADDVVLRDARSPSGWRFRSGLSGAVKTLERAVALNSSVWDTFTSPWSRSLGSLLLLYSDGERRGRAETSDQAEFEAYAAWDEDGDSVRLVPYRPGSAPVMPAELHERSMAQLRAQMSRIKPASKSAGGAELGPIASALTRDATGRGDPMPDARYGWTLARRADRRLATAILSVWLLTKRSLPDSARSLVSARDIADSVLRANPARTPRESAAFATLAVLLGRFDEATALVRRSNDASVRAADFVAELQRFTPQPNAPGHAAEPETRRALARLGAARQRRRLPAIPPTTLLAEAELLLALRDTTPASRLLAAFLDSMPAIDLESLRSPLEIAALMRTISTYVRIRPRTDVDRTEKLRWALALRALWFTADTRLQSLLDGLDMEPPPNRPS